MLTDWVMTSYLGRARSSNTRMHTGHSSHALTYMYLTWQLGRYQLHYSSLFSISQCQITLTMRCCASSHSSTRASSTAATPYTISAWGGHHNSHSELARGGGQISASNRDCSEVSGSRGNGTGSAHGHRSGNPSGHRSAQPQLADKEGPIQADHSETESTHIPIVGGNNQVSMD